MTRFFPSSSLPAIVMRGSTALLGAAAAACATTPAPATFDGGGGQNDLGVDAGGGGSASSASGAFQNGGGMLGAVDAAPTPTPDAAAHMQRCDDAGHCSCIRIASIGHNGVWGAASMDTTSVFQNWLNTQSTARVDTFDTTQPELTADFLAQYDVVVLQWMVSVATQQMDGNPWVFTQDEINALRDWVNAGGGIVALSGYQGNYPGAVVDITATNQLLSFTDITFNQVVNLTQAPAGANTYCQGGSIALGSPCADGGVPGIGTWDMSTPIGANVSCVGAYYTRTITSAGATTDCSDDLGPDGGVDKYAVHEAFGQGHIVAYADEWVTYSSQWTGLADAGQSSCTGFTADKVFQIPQFWYNAIRYAASSVSCFTISDPTIIIPR